MGAKMKNEYGGYIFVAVVLIAVISSTFIVLSEENAIRKTAIKKCEDSGRTWLSDEAKCSMIKEVK